MWMVDYKQNNYDKKSQIRMKRNDGLEFVVVLTSSQLNEFLGTGKLIIGKHGHAPMTYIKLDIEDNTITYESINNFGCYISYTVDGANEVRKKIFELVSVDLIN